MKTIKSTVSYRVPNWNFCNSDVIDMGATLPKELCKFCQKTKSGHRCLLYEAELSSQNGLVSKTKACCKATAGFASVIEPEAPEVPTVNPRELMRQAIALYSKTVNQLIDQGYPRQIAENVAKQHVTGG